MTDPVQNVLDRLDGVKRERDGQWSAKCPAHYDRNPSLSIARGKDDGRALLHCKAGCHVDAILQALGVQKRDLFPEQAEPKPNGSGKRIVKTYDYADAQGELLFQTVRYDPKDFRQRRPDGPGKWKWNLNGTPRVLYRLRAIIDADPAEWVVVVEGEKDADALAALGLTATTCPMGAGKWSKCDDSILEGRRVAIIPDRDKAGEAHAHDVARRLHSRAREVRIVPLPGNEKDASDWLDAGGTPAQLRELIEAAPSFRVEPSEPAPAESGARFRLTDMGNGERLAHRYGAELRYSAGFGWMAWDGRRWVEDRTGEVERRAKSVVRRMYAETSDCDDDDRRGKLAKWAAQSESASRIEAMMRLARSESVIAIDSAEFDRNQLAFNVENGTLFFDGSNGAHAFRPHNGDNLITRLAPVRYDPAAGCPTWDRFLSETFADDRDLIAFAQRALGSCLIGLPEEVLHVLHGGGSNGKTTMVGAIQRVFGDYMATLTPSFLAEQRSEQIQHEAMDLRGARLGVAHEPDRRMVLDEARVKLLSGRDRTKARRLYREHVEFEPTHTLFLVTNHRPRVQSQTVAIWRRVKLWPFEHVVPDDRRDPTLPDKLNAEASGILNWLVRGCAEWLAGGRSCNAPERVESATLDYRQSEDVLAEWLGECVEVVPTLTAFGTLYESYDKWARANGIERPFSRKALARMIEERGFRRRDRGGRPHFEGLKVRCP